MSKPILTIGMIVKNEERCLERCLKALQPLRDALPCELIIADTGSTDRTREIAEKYADLVFDFEWINDFAAARNSVIEKAQGEWYLSVDADEYLDPEFPGAVAFFKDPVSHTELAATVTIRNYGSLAMEDGDYSDFMAVRLVHICMGIRYRGAIHETPAFPPDTDILQIHNGLLFHHDGYAREIWRDSNKRERNKSLLREQAEQHPDHLPTLLQCIDSWENGKEREAYIHRAIDLVEKKAPRWDWVGPPVYRLAVLSATELALPDIEERIKKAFQEFPKSLFVNVDINWLAMQYYGTEKDYQKVISHGKAYFDTMADYREGRFDKRELALSSLHNSRKIHENTAHVSLATAYFQLKDYDSAASQLKAVAPMDLVGILTDSYLSVLLPLHASGWQDLTSWVSNFYDEITRPTPSKERALQRKKAFYSAAQKMFTPKMLSPGEGSDIVVPPFTAFKELAGKCEPGTAAKMLLSEDPLEIEELMGWVENWSDLPIAAVAHAIRMGAEFPPQELYTEDLDSVAGRLAESERELTLELLRTVDVETEPEWAKALAMALFHVCKWEEPEKAEEPEKTDDALLLDEMEQPKKDEEAEEEKPEEPGEEERLEILERYAEVERFYLPMRYSEASLREENIRDLPPMHRFGWYITRAFDARSAGDNAAYIRLLRQGLTACHNARKAVEFLLENFKESEDIPIPEISQELLELAGKVKTILEQFPANDPMVLQIKESAAYKQVAFILEDPQGPPQ